LGQNDFDFSNHSHIFNLPTPITDGEPMRFGDRPGLIFHAYRQGDVASPVKDENIIYNTVISDPLSAYNPATGEYTLPSDMLLLFEATCRRDGGSTNWQAVAAKYGGQNQERNTQRGANDASQIITALQLSAGEVLSAVWTWGNNSTNVPYAGNQSDTYIKIVRLS